MSDTYVVLPDDIVKVVKGDDGHLQFERNPAEEKKSEPGILYPHTERAQARLKAEMDAGKARIAAAEEQRKTHIPTPKHINEIKAEGTTVPVFRPSDFMEYAKNFKQQARARSKDA